MVFKIKKIMIEQNESVKPTTNNNNVQSAAFLQTFALKSTQQAFFLVVPQQPPAPSWVPMVLFWAVLQSTDVE